MVKILRALVLISARGICIETIKRNFIDVDGRCKALLAVLLCLSVHLIFVTLQLKHVYKRSLTEFKALVTSLLYYAVSLYPIAVCIV